MVAPKLLGCVYAKTGSAFDKVLAEIQELNDEAAEYFSRLPQQRWISYRVMFARYVYITSNILEKQNAKWLPAYDLPALYTMLSIPRQIILSMLTQKITTRPPDQFCLEIHSLKRNAGFLLQAHKLF